MKPRVWAPFAKRGVELDVDGARSPLQKGERGWWSSDVELAHGVRYRFVVDGGDPTPDPRSRSQPDGPHEASAVDEADFPWTDAGFRAAPWSAAVVYELHVGTFSRAGTFDGAIAHLEHLVELGVTHVELLPVVEFSGARGWGYDGVDLFAPHRAYGGPAGMRRFVDACHARGLGVLVDVVYNHLGPSGNYLDRFGPYFTDAHHTPWGRAVNFDQQGADEVKAFFRDNARLWLEDFHADGLRLDAVHAFYDACATPFLEELMLDVRALEARVQRPLVIVAESDLNDPRLIRARDAGGLGVDAQWSDDFHHALHVALTGERTGYYEDYDGLPDLARAIERGWVYEGQRAPSRDRSHGRALGDLPRQRLLAYAQTHDQVGNRARGERLCHLVSTERAMMAAALVLLGPATPMLFQGEEWAASSPFQYFTDHPDEQLAQSVRDGRRREFAAFGWKPEDVPDPQAERTFLDSKLDWSESGRADRDHGRVLAWHRALIALRPLVAGAPARAELHLGQGLVMKRGAVDVVVNLGARELIVPAREVLLASRTLNVAAGVVRVPAETVAVVRSA
jgi:maltooligosyltrehalose trehalohydrolase